MMVTISILVAALLALYIFRRLYRRPLLQDVDIKMRLSSYTATEGSTLTLTQVLTNANRLPLPWIYSTFYKDVQLQFSATEAEGDAEVYYRNDLHRVRMRQRITKRLPFVCSKRGYYTIGRLRLTTMDILIENKHTQDYPCNMGITVYPRTLDAHELEALNTQVYGQLSSRIRINADPFTFTGIREYSPGDSTKAINFKASAKGHGLMVNMWDFVNDRQVVILLDMKRYSVFSDEHRKGTAVKLPAFMAEKMERAISIAATIAENMTISSTPVSLVCNGKSSISGEMSNVKMGAGAQHLHSIMETLAYLDIAKQDIHSISHEIENIIIGGRHWPEYWLVTPMYSKAVEESYYRLKATGARVAWIMPGARPEDEDICEDVVFI